MKTSPYAHGLTDFAATNIDLWPEKLLNQIIQIFLLIILFLFAQNI